MTTWIIGFTHSPLHYCFRTVSKVLFHISKAEILICQKARNVIKGKAHACFWTARRWPPVLPTANLWLKRFRSEVPLCKTHMWWTFNVPGTPCVPAGRWPGSVQATAEQTSHPEKVENTKSSTKNESPFGILTALLLIHTKLCFTKWIIRCAFSGNADDASIPHIIKPELPDYNNYWISFRNYLSIQTVVLTNNLINIKT